MGLDCSHDAFHGPCSEFRRFRQAICYVIGGSYPPHKNKSFPILPDNLVEDEPLDDDLWYWDANRYAHETHPGLSIFLLHNDCEGEIQPEDCFKVAKDLEALIPKLEELDANWSGCELKHSFAELCRTFVIGYRRAIELNEPLTFG